MTMQNYAHAAYSMIIDLAYRSKNVIKKTISISCLWVHIMSPKNGTIYSWHNLVLFPSVNCKYVQVPTTKPVQVVGILYFILAKQCDLIKRFSQKLLHFVSLFLEYVWLLLHVMYCKIIMLFLYILYIHTTIYLPFANVDFLLT